MLTSARKKRSGTVHMQKVNQCSLCKESPIIGLLGVFTVEDVVRMRMESMVKESAGLHGPTKID